MDTIKAPEAIDHDRRRFLGTAAMTIAAATHGRSVQRRTTRQHGAKLPPASRAHREHLVRPTEADRCRRSQCRLRRGRSCGWSCR